MSDVPSDCFPDILSWLRVESLLRFRCVCKAWLQIIDEPEFIKLHLHRQTGGDRLIVRTWGATKVFSLPLNSLNYSKTRQKTIWAEPHKTIMSYDDIFNLPLLPVSSCNGVLLFPIEKGKRIWVLWNPFTREFRKLPPYVSSEGVSYKFRYRVTCGLGYDSVGDDYKVVIINESTETLVYSLKLNSWKRIVDFPGTFHRLGDGVGRGFFLNGALHWMSYNIKREMCITALSMDTESYRVLSVPSTFSTGIARWAVDAHLDMLGECLFLSSCYSSRLNGWIMNENGDSWTKLFSFDVREHRPLAYLKSQGLVLIRHDDGKELFWLDVEKKKAKRVEIHGGHGFCTSQVFQASLVRLNTNDGGGGGGNGAAKSIVERNRKRANNSDVGRGTSRRKRKRGDDRLKLVLTTSNAWDHGSKFKFE